MDNIVGRKNEKHVLDQVLRSAEPEFLAVYGRRRVGKTFLIREFFKKADFYFEIVGLQSGTLNVQLENFSDIFYKDVEKLDNPLFDPLKEFNTTIEID